MDSPTSPGTTGTSAITGAPTSFTDPLLGKTTGMESNLSNWAGPYVTNMLARGQAAAEMPYQAYGGPLTAGPSAGQQAAFSGIAGLTVPTAQMGAFTPQTFTADIAQKYMNPYVMTALQPQIDEARRQAAIQQQQVRGQLSKAGAYGGGRQAIMESEANRNLLTEIDKLTGAGYQNAFDKAMAQFNTEQGRQQAAQNELNAYGLQALQKQADLGAQQRDIEQQGITADINQFREERDYPLKAAQYEQSLLQGLPLSAQQNTVVQPSTLSQILSGGGGLGGLLQMLFGGNTTTPTAATPATTASPTRPV
jgi:hypothetical protein